MNTGLQDKLCSGSHHPRLDPGPTCGICSPFSAAKLCWWRSLRSSESFSKRALITAVLFLKARYSEKQNKGFRAPWSVNTVEALLGCKHAEIFLLRQSSCLKSYPQDAVNLFELIGTFKFSEELHLRGRLEMEGGHANSG